ncbi:MAG: hypothetical protein IJE43_06790 [Alphaproteobacteria bacterium]|nr:hypothetical protein [Alphaproteobacteria bacterium]
MEKKVFEAQQDFGEQVIDVAYDIEEQEIELATLDKKLRNAKIVFIGLVALTALVLVARILYG